MRRFPLVLVGMGVIAVAQGPSSPPSPISPDLIKFITPADNPGSAAKARLGDDLFDDKRLSADNTVACNTCHEPRGGFTARLETAKGIRDQSGKRNSPTIINAAFMQSQFWDGRAATLEDQAKLPILNPIEMGMKSPEEVVAKLRAIPEYVTKFNDVFGRPPNYDDMARAIAAFERTVVSTTAPIDRFLRGETNALTDAQRRGWTVFNGKGRCNSCHAFNPTFPFFTDNKFHNIGVAAHKQDFTSLAIRAERAGSSQEEIDRLALESDLSELGRFLVTKNRSDIGAFKTPGLREIAITSPYMHDGSEATLWDVMDHYNKGGEPNPFLDGGIQRLGLNEDEINDLVELMAAFTSDRFAQLGGMEMQRQRTFMRGPRQTRDNDAALGRKGHFGDAVPTHDKKDPAAIGGRPIAQSQ